jgi:hypothetical protein
MTTTTTTEEEAILFSSSFSVLLEQKIKAATEGLIDHYVNLLGRQSESNIEIICDYILAMNAELYFGNERRGKPCTCS